MTRDGYCRIQESASHAIANSPKKLQRIKRSVWPNFVVLGKVVDIGMFDLPKRFEEKHGLSNILALFWVEECLNVPRLQFADDFEGTFDFVCCQSGAGDMMLPVRAV